MCLMLTTRVKLPLTSLIICSVSTQWSPWCRNAASRNQCLLGSRLSWAAWRTRASPSLSTSGSRAERRFPPTQRPATHSSTPHTCSTQRQELWLVCVRAHVFGQGHARVARAGQQGGWGCRRWPDAQGWGQIFWGDSWWCERAWATRGIWCPRLHIPQFSLAFQHGSMCSAARPELSCQPSCWPLRRDAQSMPQHWSRN